MEKILTISIAAYNVGRYIRQTLDSLIIPEIINDLEVFVVDDGGKDDSLLIAKEYEKRYPQTFHAIHKGNGGYGSVFNWSIEHAAGKYFKLLDGDDWVSRTGLISLMNELKSIDIDILIANYFKGSDNEHLAEVTVVNKTEYIKANSIKTANIGMWALVYKTALVRESGLRLPEHSLYTDQYYSTIPFLFAESVKLSPISVYCYRIGYEEQSASKRSRIKHTDEMLKICENLAVFAEENKGTKNGRYVLMHCANYHTTAIRTLLLGEINKGNQQKIISYEQKIKEVAPTVYDKAAEMGKIGKLINLFRKTNYKAYWLLRMVPGGIKNWQ